MKKMIRSLILASGVLMGALSFANTAPCNIFYTDTSVLASPGKSITINSTSNTKKVWSNKSAYGKSLPNFNSEKVGIINQPENQRADETDYATFSVSAKGTNLKYLWQRSFDGVNWNSITGQKSSTCSFKTDYAYNKSMYRCLVSSGNKTVTSAAATLYVNKFYITKNPTNRTVEPDSWTSFTAGSSLSNVSYQWQYSYNNTLWYNSDDASAFTNTFLKYYSGSSSVGYVRCRITKGSKVLYTNVATITVKTKASEGSKVKIIKHPENVSIPTSNIAEFSVKAEGQNLKYTWQVSQNKGETWNQCYDMIPETKDVLDVYTSEKNNGYMYRCVVSSGSCSVTSNVAVLDTYTLR